MPRRKVDKPTHIYWLIDIRPEIIAAGWGSGQPFYCGKTVETPRKRLNGHRAKAKIWPNRPSHKRILECGDHIRMHIVETVPVGNDWVEREKHWIRLIRFSFPALNVSDGGVGTPGQIQSAEARAKRSATMKGHEVSEETRAKMRAAWKNRAPDSPETREKKRLGKLGRKHSDQARANMSVAQKLRPPKTAAHRAAISKALKSRHQEACSNG